mmetsp:Transcript_17719/g.32027  ORF Transcript_17719/g.32027 Transcript_17719/m.32027 type:complete len:103 (+) Transcript_17719:225-533(+)
MPCTHCHIDPCHSDSYSVALNEWAFTLRTQNNPSAVRRELYKRYVHTAYEHLGYRNRGVVAKKNMLEAQIAVRTHITGLVKINDMGSDDVHMTSSKNHLIGK